MESKILEGIAYALPALVTGAVAYFFFSSFLQHDNNEKKFKALVDKKRESLPMKLQAYERLLLFCERINPIKLLSRIQPIGDNIDDYLILLNANIEQEFEHNLVQQLYVSDDSWKAIIASKLAIINRLSEYAEQYESASEFREKSLIDFSKKESPSDTAIDFIKQEFKKLL